LSYHDGAADRGGFRDLEIAATFERRRAMMPLDAAE